MTCHFNHIYLAVLEIQKKISVELRMSGSEVRESNKIFGTPLGATLEGPEYKKEENIRYIENWRHHLK